MLAEVPLEPTSPKAQEVLDREVGLFLGGKSSGKGRGDAGAVLSPRDTVPNEADRHPQCHTSAKKLMPPWALPAPSITFVCRICFSGLQVRRVTWRRFNEPSGGQRQSRAWGGGAAGCLLGDPSSALPLSCPPTDGAWAGGDLQQRGFGAQLLTHAAVSSPWELGTGVVGDSGAAKSVTEDMMIVVKVVSSWSSPLPHSGLYPLMT